MVTGRWVPFWQDIGQAGSRFVFLAGQGVGCSRRVPRLPIYPPHNETLPHRPVSPTAHTQPATQLTRYTLHRPPHSLSTTWHHFVLKCLEVPRGGDNFPINYLTPTTVDRLPGGLPPNSLEFEPIRSLTTSGLSHTEPTPTTTQLAITSLRVPLTHSRPFYHPSLSPVDRVGGGLRYRYCPLGRKSFG